MFKDCEKKQKMGMSKDQIQSQPVFLHQLKEIRRMHNEIKSKFL